MLDHPARHDVTARCLGHPVAAGYPVAAGCPVAASLAWAASGPKIGTAGVGAAGGPDLVRVSHILLLPECRWLETADFNDR
jgi:hypothetical protein